MSAEESTPDTQRQALLELSEQLAPMYEFAAGQKAVLTAQGWSELVAEQIAATILGHLLERALTPPTPGAMLAAMLGGGSP
jgi:hypothetical protein